MKKNLEACDKTRKVITKKKMTGQKRRATDSHARKFWYFFDQNKH